MTRIVAFLDRSHMANIVMRTAQELAAVLRAEVHPVTITDEEGLVSVAPVAAMLERLQEDDVALAVLGTRAFAAKPEPVGHVAAALLTRSPVPLAVVPPTAAGFGVDQPRFLLPLDGDPATDRALLPVAAAFRDGGAGIVGLHVYSSESVPRFIRSSHDLETLSDEFVVQHLPGICDSCELRIGPTERVILERAFSSDIDGVIVAWRQDFSPGRGEVVRRLLAEVRLPVVIVPLTRPERSGGFDPKLPLEKR